MICSAPFIGLHKSDFDSFAPCCESKMQFLQFKNIESYINSEELMDAKKQLLSGKFPDSCSACATANAIGTPALNQLWLSRSNGKSYDINYFKLQYLDYRASNKCNLTCRSCDAVHSNKIFDEIESKPKLIKFFGQNKKRLYPDTFTDYAVAHASDIKHLKLLGGEPMVDNKLADFLSSLIYGGMAPENVHITTNGTVINHKILNSIKIFKFRSLNISLDDIGQNLEYTRRGSDWVKIQENIDFYFNSKFFNQISFNIVVSAYNVANLIPLFNYFKEKSNLNFNINFISANGVSALSSVKSDVIQKSINLLNEWQTKNSDSRYKITELLKILSSIKFQQDHFDNFQEYEDILNS